MHLDPEGTSLVPVAENLPGGDLCPLPASESISLPSVWAWGWGGRTGSRITTLPDIRHPLSCLHWAGPLWAWHCLLCGCGILWGWHCAPPPAPSGFPREPQTLLLQACLAPPSSSQFDAPVPEMYPHWEGGLLRSPCGSA